MKSLRLTYYRRYFTWRVHMHVICNFAICSVRFIRFVRGEENARVRVRRVANIGRENLLPTQRILFGRRIMSILLLPLPLLSLYFAFSLFCLKGITEVLGKDYLYFYMVSRCTWVRVGRKSRGGYRLRREPEANYIRVCNATRFSNLT